MHRAFRSGPAPWTLVMWVALVAGGAWAQAPSGSESTLKRAFEAAWERQPEAASEAARRDAAEAERRAAAGWSVEPGALELATRTDRLNANGGSREYEVAVAVPLWLPRERARAGDLADAQLSALDARREAVRLRVAASVRETWWADRRARLEATAARDRLARAQQLAADVARRVRAGDLARSDQFQADSAVAQAEVALAQAHAASQAAALALQGLTGAPVGGAGEGTDDPEPMPAVPADLRQLDPRHPEVVALVSRAQVSRRAAELAATQTRANPELVVGTTRDRGGSGEPFRQTVTVGLRLPFGAGSRADSKVASARAEAIEAQSQAALEQSRLISEIAAAQVQASASGAQIEATQRHARLAREVRGFFETSFRLGESDLPTRLRVELEAAEADRQAARARLEGAAAVSALRQALGLLPE